MATSNFYPAAQEILCNDERGRGGGDASNQRWRRIPESGQSSLNFPAFDITHEIFFFSYSIGQTVALCVTEKHLEDEHDMVDQNWPLRAR